MSSETTQERHEREIREAIRDAEKDCAEHCARMNEAQIAVANLYDKGLLYLGGGALAVSLIFIEKISPQPSATLVWILGASWALLVIGMSTHLAALFCSQRAIVRAIIIAQETLNEHIDTCYGNQTGPLPKIAKKNHFSTATALLSPVAATFVVCGILSLCTFAVVSLTSKTNDPNVKTTSSTSTTTTTTTSSITTGTSDQSRNLHTTGLPRATPPTATPATGEKIAEPKIK